MKNTHQPAYHGALCPVPLSALHTAGWLETFLKVQREGLTGHMEAAGYPFDTAGWAAEKMITGGILGWWPYEQTAYWVDGAIRCGQLLRDQALINKAHLQIDYALRHTRSGFIGPAFLKKNEYGNRWPHAVFFRALMAEYEATGSGRVLQRMIKHYQSDTYTYAEQREVCNAEILCWLYGQTGDERMLQRAEDGYREYNRRAAGQDCTVKAMLSDRRLSVHGVTFNEIGKLGAVLYLYTGNQRYLRASVNAYRKVDRDQMLIDGVHSSTECLRGNGPLESHETCDIADYTWSLGYLLMATGRVEYADKIERACFNAGMGAIKTDTFGGCQYFSCPNQTIADRCSNHNEFYMGDKWMSYRPNPGTECCPGEMHRIMPNYAARMWMRGRKNEVAAVLYGPGSYRWEQGGQMVTLREKTYYPFSPEIEFTVDARESVRFTLLLRIPQWCKGAGISFNGKELNTRCRPGRFARITRTFKPGDRITLLLPMKPALEKWPGPAVGISLGPLVFALGIQEDWQVDAQESRQTKAFPAWNLYPASRWNYGLDLKNDRVAERIKVHYGAVSMHPWTLEHAPICLEVPARRIKGWTQQRRKQIKKEIWDGVHTHLVTEKGDFVFTPPLPDLSNKSRLGQREETIRLVPYGATHLRISLFPFAE